MAGSTKTTTESRHALHEKGLREYVRSSDLAELIEEWTRVNDSHYHELARRAGVSPRAISKILNNERQFQTVFLADRLLVAMDRHLIHVDTVWRRPGKECK